MRTYFTLIKVCNGGTSTITKSIDGDLTIAQVTAAVDADEHCRELFDGGWWLDEFSVRHYVVRNEPIEQ